MPTVTGRYASPDRRAVQVLLDGRECDVQDGRVEHVEELHRAEEQEQRACPAEASLLVAARGCAHVRVDRHASLQKAIN
jgi:hypothetical protein